MSRNTTEKVFAERRTLLADWVTAIFSIFWSVWWGFYMDRLLRQHGGIKVNSSDLKILTSDLEIMSKEFFLFILVILAAIFSIIYVRWLWHIQTKNIGLFTLDGFVKHSIPLFTIIVTLSAGVWLTKSSYGFNTGLILYGITLMWIWPITVMIAIRNLQSE